MKVIHNNFGLFGGYHFRIVKDKNIYKIQECFEATQDRYKTIAKMSEELYQLSVDNYDLSNPAELLRWSRDLNSVYDDDFASDIDNCIATSMLAFWVK